MKKQAYTSIAIIILASIFFMYRKIISLVLLFIPLTIIISASTSLTSTLVKHMAAMLLANLFITDCAIYVYIYCTITVLLLYNINGRGSNYMLLLRGTFSMYINIIIRNWSWQVCYFVMPIRVKCYTFSVDVHKEKFEGPAKIDQNKDDGDCGQGYAVPVWALRVGQGYIAYHQEVYSLVHEDTEYGASLPLVLFSFAISFELSAVFHMTLYLCTPEFSKETEVHICGKKRVHMMNYHLFNILEELKIKTHHILHCSFRSFALAQQYNVIENNTRIQMYSNLSITNFFRHILPEDAFSETDYK
ncbi:hypothetical protein ACJX0J_035562, partial [Zea mays]